MNIHKQVNFLNYMNLKIILLYNNYSLKLACLKNLNKN